MFKTTCPSCGAPVSFRSAASTMAVCAYCNSTLLKDADAVKDIGKMGEVLEDYSPIQIPTSGTIDGEVFTVIGRIQLRYDAGFWNEWYVMFQDGKDGWLSDASGQYVFTRAITTNPRLPGFEQYHPGKQLVHEGKVFYASDVRTARCTAGEGELPFKVGQGWETKTIDMRNGTAFMTLDFSEATPQQYLGRAVTLQEMKCQLLRDGDTIAEKAGKYPGKLQPLDCPSCGTSIPYVPGLASQLVCPTCKTELDASSTKAEVVKKQALLDDGVKPSLTLGDTAKLDGVSWQLIGAMAVRGDDGAPWGEYLLFNAAQGFLWLVELVDGDWTKVHVLNAFPENWTNNSVGLGGGRHYQMLYRYNGSVVYAAGAFNWRVSVGDTENYVDYANGNDRICMERTPQEITWSQSSPLSATEVKAAFGGKLVDTEWLQQLSTSSPAATEPLAADTETPVSGGSIKPVAKFFSWLLVIANIGALESGSSWVVILIALAILWAPVLVEGNS